jgi:bifunctional lysine-specific demethylase and histidyl-hydroxylase NO66
MHEPWLDDPLGYLIGAERIDAFWSGIYEREPLVVAHDDPARFAGLVTITQVDRIVTQTDLRTNQLDLADATRTLTRANYSDSAGYIDRGAVADFHRGGATIILQQAHQIEPTLGRFCRGLEYVFSAHVQTNLYLTPPNAQGFKTHYDSHDVFVLQMEGEKAWRLYEKPVDTPYRGEKFHSAVHAPGKLTHEFVLKAGDCAYVPRGLMHDALTSGDKASLHVTVGLITRTWADFMLEAVSEAALRLPDMRRSLPAGFANPGFDRTAARETLKRLSAALAKAVHLDPALDLIADTFIRSRAADNRDAVREAARPVLEHESFQLQKHTPYRIAEDDGALVLIAPGGELKFPETRRPALERALNGAPFKPSDLGGDKPCNFVAKILAYGLIKRV